MNYQFDIQLLRDAVYQSADKIKELRDTVQINSKDSIVDLVTSADLASEKILLEAIKSIFPNDGIISEESEIVNPGAERTWVIDPLDGTVNYANNIPQVAITVLLLEKDIPVQTYILDIYQDILYEGYKDQGAFKNGETLKILKKPTLENALIATGFPYDRTSLSSDYIPTFESVLRNTGGIRRFGSAALDVCWIADNKFDGYFEFFMKPWDTLGASLILQEAGGKVTDESFNFPGLNSKLLMASNSLIHDNFVKLVTNNLSENIKRRIY
jgi:myo-inositol-1(or 4)-monophosphatase